MQVTGLHHLLLDSTPYSVDLRESEVAQGVAKNNTVVHTLRSVSAIDAIRHGFLCSYRYFQDSWAFQVSSHGLGL